MASGLKVGAAVHVSWVVLVLLILAGYWLWKRRSA